MNRELYFISLFVLIGAHGWVINKELNNNLDSRDLDKATIIAIFSSLGFTIATLNK